MNDFRFHMYTEIVFGHNAESQAGRKVREHGGSKVMMVTGEGSVRRSGLYDKLIQSLRDENIPFVELSGVQPNPLLSLAYKGLELAKQEHVDFLLGVGGGSAIDTAKGIALGLSYEGDLWDFFTGKAIPTKMAPVGTIPTLAAAGSETSRSSVLVDDLSRVKKGFMYDPCRPVFALMNPEWTMTLPAYQSAAGAADIFAHVVERYFFPGASYLGDKFGESIMRSLIKHTPIVLADPANYDARAEIMLAGSFGHNDIAGLGRSNLGLEGSCHSLEAQISGTCNTTHGAGLSVIMPAWMEFTYQKTKSNQFVKFASEVFDVERDLSEPDTAAMEGIRRFKSWLTDIGMPITLRELGLKKDDLEVIIRKSLPDSGNTIGSLAKLNAEEAAKIYQLAF